MDFYANQILRKSMWRVEYAKMKWEIADWKQDIRNTKCGSTYENRVEKIQQKQCLQKDKHF